MDGYRGWTVLGRVVYGAFAWVFSKMRAAAYADIEGRYYEFKGNPIDIHEEPNGERWLSLRDLRRTLSDLPRDPVLKRVCASRLREIGQPRELRIEARAVESLLIRAQDAATIRFLRWLQRDVIHPAQVKATRAKRTP
jgi:hypothetical protein